MHGYRCRYFICFLLQFKDWQLSERLNRLFVHWTDRSLLYQTLPYLISCCIYIFSLLWAVCSCGSQPDVHVSVYIILQLQELSTRINKNNWISSINQITCKVWFKVGQQTTICTLIHLVLKKMKSGFVPNRWIICLYGLNSFLISWTFCS